MNVFCIGIGPIGGSALHLVEELCIPTNTGDAEAVSPSPSLPGFVMPEVDDADAPSPVDVTLIVGSDDAPPPEVPVASGSEVPAPPDELEAEPEAILTLLATVDSEGHARVIGRDVRQVADAELPLSEWLRASARPDDPPAVVVVGGGVCPVDVELQRDAWLMVNRALSQIPESIVPYRAALALAPAATAGEGMSPQIVAMEQAARELPIGPRSGVFWLSDWAARGHLSTDDLAELMALFLAANIGVAQADSVLAAAATDANGGDGQPWFSVDLFGATVPDGALALAGEAAASLCDRFLQRNEDVPIEYSPITLVASRLLLTSELATAQLMRIPTDPTVGSDMRLELERDLEPDWSQVPESGWPDLLRNARREIVVSRMRRLGDWLTENWEHWTRGVQAKTGLLAGDLVEREMISLADAKYITEKLDERLSHLRLAVLPLDEVGGKNKFDLRVEALTRAIESKPFKEGIVARYGLLAIVLFPLWSVLMRLGAPLFLTESPPGWLLTALAAVLSAAVALCGTLLHLSRANGRIERLRTAAIRSLSNWLTEDLENLGTELIERTIQALHLALEKGVLPKLAGFIAMHEALRDSLRAGGVEAGWRYVRPADELLGGRSQDDRSPRRFVAAVEAQEYVRERLRGGWMDIDESTLRTRLLEYCRTKMQAEEQASVEAFLQDSGARLLASVGAKAQTPKSIGGALLRALEVKRDGGVRSPAFRFCSSVALVPTTVPDDPFWGGIEGSDARAVRWLRAAPLTLSVEVRRIEHVIVEAEPYA